MRTFGDIEGFNVIIRDFKGLKGVLRIIRGFQEFHGNFKRF